MAGGVLCVMFTDLAGSTELMTRLGDTAFDPVRGEHFAALREAISDGGGVEVKNTGDGLLATFTSAVEALAAAVRIQQVTEGHGRVIGVPMVVRVGLALGEVAIEDGDVFGTPVVEAARLVGAAHAGQILTTALVRAVAGTRAGVPFTDLGCLELKGLPEQVAACEVGWEPLKAQGVGPVPLPGLLLRTGRIFVGRGAELDYLQTRWKETSAGGRALVLLGGEPGVGKTRLAAGLAAMLHEDGALVLAGRCDEDMGVPYQPFVEALRHYATHAPQPLRLGRHAGELVRLVPELARLDPALPEPLSSDPETERYRLFEALAGWLGDVSAETPVLLVLDDLHWATKPTLLLLRHLVRSDEPMRLLVVATFRDTEISPRDAFAEFLADLPRLDGASRLPLGGLNADGVASFLEAAAGHALDAEGVALAETVWRETEGNCFFVAEVLRHLAESGAFEERDGRWWSATALATSVPIPDGVRAVVARRLSRLSEGANRVLAVAAVAGLEFDPAVIRAAGPFSEEEVLTALEVASAARLVAEVPGPVPRNRFAHAIVRSTLYDDLSGARLQSLHRRMAEAIEVIQLNHLEDHLPALTHHWSQAGAADTAADYAARAGDRALAQLAFDEAAAFFAQALELVGPDDARRVELLISLGDAQRRAADPAYRETLLEAARLAQARGNADALASAVLANSRPGYVSVSGTVDAERVEVLEAALAATGGVASPARARLLASLGGELVYTRQRDRRVRLSDEALSLARGIGDPTTLAHVLLARFYTISSPSTVAERMANSAELLELADRLGDPVVAFLASWQRVRVTFEAGDLAAAAANLERAESMTGDLGQPTFRWLAMLFRVGQVILAGRLDEADRLVEATSAIGTATGQPDAVVLDGAQRFLLRYEQGRLPEVEPRLTDMHGRYPGVPGVAIWLALLHCEDGRLEEARRVIEPVAATAFDLPLDAPWLGFMTQAAEVARVLGDVRMAAVLHDLLLPHAAIFSVSAGISTGCTAHYVGVLATMMDRFPEAEKHFAFAADAHARIGAPAHLGRTRVEWARMFLARRGSGDAERARQLLDQTLTVATDLGLVNVERRARSLMETAS